jgi:hypothetical protein
VSEPGAVQQKKRAQVKPETRSVIGTPGGGQGLAWHHETERYRLGITPQYEFTWDPRFVGTGGPAFVGGWTNWALPWVEGGFWITPTLGLGARFGSGIAQAVWRF